MTSGIITTLGLMVGLDSGTHSKAVVIGGILTIAIADAFSDALGMHVSEEAEVEHTQREVWESTVATFLAKFLFALTFLVPVMLLDLSSAMYASIVWGVLVLGILSYQMGREQGNRPWAVVTEHVFIAVLVIIITHFVGDWIGAAFRA